MDRLRFRMWTQYPDEEPCWASDYEMHRCMLEKSYTITNGVYHCDPEEGYQIIEQCTGLKDVNGKLIYEGDLLRFTTGYNQTIFKVAWYIAGWSRLLLEEPIGGTPLHPGEPLEIIGNIHENGEILEDER